jgi:hypothetical protein
MTRSIALAAALSTLLTASLLVVPAPVVAADPVLVGAGDISDCGSAKDEETATLLDAIPGTVVTLGDNAYTSGSAGQYRDCYDPTWGRHKSRTKPSAGNHEYETSGATGYFGYFGAKAGPAGKGWYSYDLGRWHMIVLNSNCGDVGCGPNSAQLTWLRADLAANAADHVIAYWHHPRFSSGEHGSSTASQALYQALYDFNADLVLVGHDHDYERFAPQTATGVANSARGIRQIVVGTGGRSHYPFPGAFVANSEAHNADTFGLLKLTLTATGYSWQFLPQAGATFADSGSTACH